jgi:hypothetical protein
MYTKILRNERGCRGPIAGQVRFDDRVEDVPDGHDVLLGQSASFLCRRLTGGTGQTKRQRREHHGARFHDDLPGLFVD